jgi:hypothetical protein
MQLRVPGGALEGLADADAVGDGEVLGEDDGDSEGEAEAEEDGDGLGSGSGR